MIINFYELSFSEVTKQIQPGDGANFTKEIADKSEGAMTGQKRRNVSTEGKPPPRKNGNQAELLPLNQLFQNYKIYHNWYLEDQYDRFGKHVAGQLRITTS